MQAVDVNAGEQQTGARLGHGEEEGVRALHAVPGGVVANVSGLMHAQVSLTEKTIFTCCSRRMER